MKKDILKIAGVKSEKEFYKKYPTEAAFMKAHKKEFKKAAMGASMVNKQLTQLTDFSNPPQAQVGAFIGGEQSSYKPTNYTDLYDQADYANTGSNRQMRMQEQNLAAQQKQAANAGKGGGLDLGSLMQSAGGIAKLAESLRQGGYVPKAFDGEDIVSQFAPQLASYSKGMINSPTGQVTKAQTEALGFNSDGSNFNSNKFALGMQNFGKSLGAGYDKLDSSLGKIGGVQGAAGIGTDLIQGFQQLKEEKQQQRGAHQAFELSGLTKQVAGLTPDIQKRKYLRPEDQAFDTQEMGQAYGAGTNFLAEDGAMVGGNPTEIQNMYNPGDIYSDMGYEPLSDSEIVKQYRRGGLIPKAQFGADKMAGQLGGSLGSLIGGGHGTPNAGGKIGSTVGSTVGKFIPIPGASAILGGVGGLIGGIAGGKSAKKTEAWQTGTQQNTNDAAFMSGAKNIQGQNASFMEDGGWVSHDWQPQVITQFGDYDVKDLFKADPTMDTLRSGGHLGQVPYTPASARAMSTERPDFAMGGELKTHWGGGAEPISYNPYLPDGGETVMFRGQSHDESDGKGRTGIGVTYGNNPVEVERGEPAVKLQDGGNEESLVVYGNMPIPSYGISELGDKKAKGKKFKSYANDLSKIEAKQNKTVEKGLTLIDDVDSDNPFDQLKLQAGHAMVTGANMKLKELASKKKLLAGIQNAILETAEERGLESDALAKGKIKKAKASDMAKFGAKLETAQFGMKTGVRTGNPLSDYLIQGLPLDPTLNFQIPSGNLQIPFDRKKAGNTTQALEQQAASTNQDAYVSSLNDRWNKYLPEKSPNIPVPWRSEQDARNFKNAIASKKTDATKTDVTKKDETKKDRFGLEDAYSMLYPYIKPLIKNPLGPEQLAPDMYSLANNQLEPVQAQTYNPLLETPYSVSFQDQMNANQADFNAIERQLGSNPSALASLAAQKYAANSGVLGQQARANQELKMGAYNRNRATLNDAALKNLATYDQQYVRQSQAKSATKAQAHEALASIADKIARNKSETLQANIQANMYPQYSFGPKGRMYNTGLTNFNIPQVAAGLSADQLQTLLDQKKAEEKKSGTKARNGSIVKALKNL